MKQKLNISESQNIEFKEAWRDEYLKWICGFANAVGGKLYIGVNDVHESRPRNQLIARVFYLAGFIESWGRGYEKIRDQFAAMQLAMPTFEVVRGGMMTTILREKAKSMVSITPQVTPKFTPQFTPQVTPQVKGLLSVLNSGDKNVLELMDLLKLKDRRNFRLNYLQPALSAGLVAMTIPEKPNSRLQRYRLVKKE